MEFQDFIQKMPDELLSDRGKQFKQTVNNWFPDESESIMKALQQGNGDSTIYQAYSDRKDSKDTDVPTWSKQ